MSEQEPHPLSKPRVLRVKAPDEANKGTGTVVRRQDRGRILAAERVSRALLKRASKEATVEVEERYEQE